MKKVYKGIFLKQLRHLIAKGLLQTAGIAIEELIQQAGYKSWNVYAKAPFGNVASVVEYLGRYTHSPRWITHIG